MEWSFFPGVIVGMVLMFAAFGVAVAAVKAVGK